MLGSASQSTCLMFEAHVCQPTFDSAVGFFSPLSLAICRLNNCVGRGNYRSVSTAETCWVSRTVTYFCLLVPCAPWVENMGIGVKYCCLVGKPCACVLACPRRSLEAVQGPRTNNASTAVVRRIFFHCSIICMYSDCLTPEMKVAVFWPLKHIPEFVSLSMVLLT